VKKYNFWPIVKVKNYLKHIFHLFLLPGDREAIENPVNKFHLFPVTVGQTKAPAI
jgi:hypothetical protein